MFAPANTHTHIHTKTHLGNYHITLDSVRCFCYIVGIASTCHTRCKATTFMTHTDTSMRNMLEFKKVEKEITSKSCSSMGPFESVQRDGGTLSNSMSELNWLKSPPAGAMWRSSSVPVKTLNNAALNVHELLILHLRQCRVRGRQQLAHETRFIVKLVQTDTEAAKKERKRKAELDAFEWQ